MVSFFSLEQTPRPPLGPNWDCTAWFVYLANCLPPVRTCVCASECACISFCIGTHKRRGTFREAHAARALCAHTGALARVSRLRVRTVNPSGALHPGRSAAYWHTIRYIPEVQKCQMGGAAGTCESVFMFACKRRRGGWKCQEACRLTQ